MALTVEAQSTNTNTSLARVTLTNLPTAQRIEQDLTAPSRTATQNSLMELPAPAKPNEILKGNLSYSGSAVQAVKTRRPWQLLNPAAPPQYGSPEDNVARDQINGRVTGLKVFQIRF
jgi:hypothetical protein